MQFMLDARLSDVDRYPLKLSDLIVTPIDKELAPEKLVWASSPDLEYDGSIPNVGLSGDRYYRPMTTVGDHVEFTGSVLSVDPSGRGKDETGYAVVKMLNGTLFVPEAGGLSGGYDEATLKNLTVIAKEHKVNAIIIESNFGDGMFVELLKPILNKIYPCTIEEVRHSKQKELRIIETLEPVMANHRLVVDPKVIRKDYDSCSGYKPESQLKYQLFYQMSRITRDRGAITHDDRLDALSMAVGYWVEQMAQDADLKMQERKHDLIKEQLLEFENTFYKRNKGTLSVNKWI